MNIFFDTEFTGLHKNTSLISIGLVADSGEKFYGELTDYDPTQVDDWIRENVINNLILGDFDMESDYFPNSSEVYFKGTKKNLKVALEHWFSRFPEITIWGDVLGYDWVLFCDIWGHAFNIPSNIYYIPMDFATFLLSKGIDPDISREEIAAELPSNKKHNSLWDASMIRAGYFNVKNIPSKSIIS